MRRFLGRILRIRGSLLHLIQRGRVEKRTIAPLACRGQRVQEGHFRYLWRGISRWSTIRWCPPKGEKPMAQHILVELEVPTDLDKFQLPKGVNERLQELLDRQDRGEGLTTAERTEAEGLVDLAELLSLLRLRTQRVWQEGSHEQ